MKNLHKKKVNVLGKKVPVLMLALVVVIGLGTAALLPYFGQITGQATVTQGLLVDGMSVDGGSDSIEDSYGNFTSLEEKNYASNHTLTNNANTEAILKFSLLEKADGGSDFEDINTEYYVASQEPITAAADRLVQLQHSNGSWDWVVTGQTDPSDKTFLNIAGVTAQGLLTAYKATGNESYLDAAKNTGEYLIGELGNSISKEKKMNAFNAVFLYDLGELTEEKKYSNQADILVNHILSEENYWSNNAGSHCDTNGCTASELMEADKNNRNDLGIVMWDLATWVEAANLAGKDTFASNLTSEMGDEYPNMDSTGDYYNIGLTGVISATGNSDAVEELLDRQNSDGYWSSESGKIQDTTYAVMALLETGNYENIYAAVQGAKWLNESQEDNGGWLESNNKEYSEVTSEAIQAVPLTKVTSEESFTIPANAMEVPFNIVNEFPQMLVPDTYNFETNVTIA